MPSESISIFFLVFDFAALGVRLAFFFMVFFLVLTGAEILIALVSLTIGSLCSIISVELFRGVGMISNSAASTKVA